MSHSPLFLILQSQIDMSSKRNIQDKAIRLLKQHKLRNTSVRNEVLQLFLKENRALSNKDIETVFPELDRITLYRTLKAFQEHGLVHKAIDGTDTSRYALCDECTTKEHQHEHAHLHCDECQNTYCLEDLTPPDIRAVRGIKVKEVELVVKGTCAQCLSAR